MNDTTQRTNTQPAKLDSPIVTQTGDVDNSRNDKLLARGWIPIPADKLAEYTDAEKTANLNGRGVWLDVNGVLYERRPPTDALEAALWEQLPDEFLQSVEDDWPGSVVEPDDLELLPAMLMLLDAVEGSREALETFALEQIENLAEMSKADVAAFCSALRAKGVTAEWVRVDLRPAINEAKRDAAQSGQPSGGGSSDGATWRHYIAAAARLGYTFRLNDLNDTVETNGASIEKPARGGNPDGQV